MTNEKLEYLIMLAEEKNVTKAAKRLFITQPTLTTYITNLETNLGFKIFDRSRNPVLLTKAGMIYLEKMKRLLEEEHMLIENLRTFEHAQNEIKIGIGQIHSEMWIPQLLKKLCTCYPSLNITVREGQEMRIMEWLRNEEIDIFFGHTNIDNVNFHFQELCEERLLLIIPQKLIRDYLDEYRLDFSSNVPEYPQIIKPEILSSLPVIEPSAAQGLYLNFKYLLDKYHIHPIRTLQTSNMITAASMLKMGLGYMYISPSILHMTPNRSTEPLLYCKLPKMQESRKYYVAYKKRNPNIQIIQDIIQMMGEIVR